MHVADFISFIQSTEAANQKKCEADQDSKKWVRK